MRPETILLLEDNPDSLVILRGVLNNAGFRVLEATDGEEAAEVVRQHRRELSLMISDVVLSGVAGPAIVGKVKRFCPDLPVLYISGHAREELLNRGLLDREELESGENRFLQKPFTSSELKERVAAILSSQSRNRG